MANIRRGLERIGKFFEGHISNIYRYIIDDPFHYYQPSVYGTKVFNAQLSRYGSAAVEGLIKGGIIAWAPFLLFKYLYWIGIGFVDDEGKSETETQ